jgi:hypothetical protein
VIDYELVNYQASKPWEPPLKQETKNSLHKDNNQASFGFPKKYFAFFLIPMIFLLPLLGLTFWKKAKFGKWKW